MIGPMSSYALPLNHSAATTIPEQNSVHHARSYSTTHLSPSPPSPDDLFAKPYFPAVDANKSAYASNFHSHDHQPEHQHIRSHSHSSMKKSSSRARGESDLGRPAAHIGNTSSLGSVLALRISWLSLPEVLTSLLVPLPYLFASAVPSQSACNRNTPPSGMKRVYNASCSFFLYFEYLHNNFWLQCILKLRDMFY